MTTCYICNKTIDSYISTFPFCSVEHHEEWAKENYPEENKSTKKSRFNEFLKNPRVIFEEEQ